MKNEHKITCLLSLLSFMKYKFILLIEKRQNIKMSSQEKWKVQHEIPVKKMNYSITIVVIESS